MKGSFTKRGRRCDVTVTKTHLKCILKANLGPDVSLSIPLDDILAVENSSRDSGAGSTVLVHYAAHKKNNALSWAKLVLSADADLCKELKTIFSTTLAERLRPKHYLVVINPASGKKIGSQLFHKKVAPLLRACGATFRVYETQGKNDYDNAVKDVDFSELDGLLAMGGDGHYSKLATACMRKQQASCNVDVENVEEVLKPLNCPMGLLPAGSGTYMNRYMHGTTDLMTAAVHVILGKTTPSNLASVHQGGQLVGFSGLILGYGLFGDMMAKCESCRWMGNFRYTVMPIRSIMSRRFIDDIHLDIQRESTPDQWDTLNTSLYSINTNVVDLSDDSSNLVPVFGDSALTVSLTSQCPLGQHIKHLSKVAAHATGAFEFDFVKCERVLRYRIRLPNKATKESPEGPDVLAENFYLNLDGEAVLIDNPVCDIRLHQGAVRLFGSKND